MPFQGKIDQAGYTPPPAVIVHWSNGAQKPLDPSKDFAGWHDSDIPRYGGGDQSLAPHHPTAVGVEQRGGEADRILRKLFETQGGPDRDPTPREVSDFAVVHGGKRILGVGDWLALAGVPSPVKQGAPGSSARFAIPAHTDDPAQNGRVVQVDGKFYILDSVEQGLPPLPKSTQPAEPAPPPPQLPPPVQPNPPAGVITRQIDYSFNGREEFSIPVGARSVVFNGALLLGDPVKDETRSPIISTKLGPKPKKGKRRFDAGTAVVNAKGGLAIEANDKPSSAGGPPLSIGVSIPFTYEWTTGMGARASAAGREAVTDPIAARADQGGVVVLGVEKSDDPKADYVLLPEGSSLSGLLTITLAGSQPGPVIPPAVPGASILELAKASLAKAEDARSAAAALVNALEGS